MIVACSTLCFGKYPFERALSTMVELGFTKFDVAIHEEGPHLRPSEVAADVHAAVNRLRLGSGLAPCAFSLVLGTENADEATSQFHAVCRMARLSSVSLLSIPAAGSGSGLDAEVRRLAGLTRIAAKEGVILSVPTVSGTLTEDPDVCVTLCKKVPGLGLTLDPSYFVSGPHSDKPLEPLYPFVRHVRLRDTGKGPHQFQVRVGQGEIEYGRIISLLTRQRYDRVLSVDIRDIPDAPFIMESEVRKLKYLLESLV